VSTPGDFDARVEALPDGIVVVHVSGELDLATASVLEEALSGSLAAPRVVIDLAACSFLDSSGVRVLATAARTIDERGGRLDVVAANDSGVARVLEITRIDTLVGVHSSLDEAL
jgi:anti-sigma B factor antagonist